MACQEPHEDILIHFLHDATNDELLCLLEIAELHDIRVRYLLEKLIE